MNSDVLGPRSLRHSRNNQLFKHFAGQYIRPAWPKSCVFMIGIFV